MPRRKRVTPGGYVYRVLNRGVGRITIFNKPEDYQAFVDILIGAEKGDSPYLQ